MPGRLQSRPELDARRGARRGRPKTSRRRPCSPRCQDQLGLRLRAQKVTIRTLVVDHVETGPVGQLTACARSWHTVGLMRKHLTLTLAAAACALLIGCSSSNEIQEGRGAAGAARRRARNPQARRGARARRTGETRS